MRVASMKLISYYGVNNDIKVVKDITLDEINLDSLEYVINQFNDDFSMPSNSYKQPLRLIKFLNVINYIEKSAELAITKIEDIIEIKY
jgi:hypothetical protein